MSDLKDDSRIKKRTARNICEKKRRKQMTELINELGKMIGFNGNKQTKLAILRSTISFLQMFNGRDVYSPEEKWLSHVLPNEHLLHLKLEATSGFLIAFNHLGQIFYAFDNVAYLLGYPPKSIRNINFYDVIHRDDQLGISNILLARRKAAKTSGRSGDLSFMCRIRRGDQKNSNEQCLYEPVTFAGCYGQRALNLCKALGICHDIDNEPLFVAVGHLLHPLLNPEIWNTEQRYSEFISIHNLEWKFVSLDHRGSDIIGYLPEEILGTSGYSYYHMDDLDRIAKCHHLVMQKEEQIRCSYRFLTKSEQWVWLEAHFLVIHDQGSKSLNPEFIVCMNRVMNHPKEPEKTFERNHFGGYSLG